MNLAAKQFLTSAHDSGLVKLDEMPVATNRINKTAGRLTRKLDRLPHCNEVEKFKRQAFQEFIKCLQSRGFINEHGNGESLNDAAAGIAEEYIWHSYLTKVKGVKNAELATMHFDDENLNPICIELANAMGIDLNDFIRASTIFGKQARNDIKQHMESTINWNNFLFNMDDIQIYIESDKEERQEMFPNGIKPTFDLIYESLESINKAKHIAQEKLGYFANTTITTTSALSSYNFNTVLMND